MPDPKRVHITPHPDGWQVRPEGADRATRVVPTQSEAIQIGRQVAQNRDGQLLVHGTNGQIREERSYGNDPFPPKG